MPFRYQYFLFLKNNRIQRRAPKEKKRILWRYLRVSLGSNPSGPTTHSHSYNYFNDLCAYVKYEGYNWIVKTGMLVIIIMISGQEIELM